MTQGTNKNYQVLSGKKINGMDIVPLFKECFCNDEYYKEHILLDTSFDDWCDNLIPQFDYCLNSGYSYVFTENNEIIGFFLAFDYFDCKENNYEMFEEIFKDSSSNKIPYMDLIHNNIHKGENKTIFLLLIAVSLNKRGNKLASKIVDKMLFDNSNCNMFGDVDNVLSLGMYDRRGFFKEKIDTDYFLIKKEV